MFIVLEGPDGCGKSETVRRLYTLLTNEGHLVRTTREPGGTPYAERIRELMLFPGATSEDSGYLTKLLLAYAARNQHIQHVINPSLERGEVVICDRFKPSTFVFQSGEHCSKVMRTLDECMPLVREPVYIFLDVSYDERCRRVNARGEAGGEIEEATSSPEKHEMVRSLYRECMTGLKCIQINTDDLTLDQVAQKAYSYVKNLSESKA